jgi:cytoskeletal protein RodZ
MSEFGKTLRAAREAKGLTAGQIAEQTHMMVQTVEGLENETFDKIVAPIYGRGFVKLYCEAVGLEPKPLVDEFIKLYADRHAAPDKLPPSTSAPTPPPQAPSPSAPPKSAAPVAVAPPPKAPELDFSSAQNVTPSISRYAGTLPTEPEPSFSMPSINWRLVALIAGAFVVLLCISLVVRAIYHASMSTPSEDVGEQTAEQVEQVQQPAPAQPDSQDKTEKLAPAQPAARKPLPLKPFYIDSDHSSELERKN